MYLGMRLAHVNLDYMQVSLIINSVGIMIGVNTKNWLIKKDMIKDLFGILVYANVNVINPVIFDNI